MSKLQKRTGPLYVDGVIVGEVEITGNSRTDIATARQFLKEKGLHRETSLVQAMRRQAVSFSTTAARLYKHDLVKIPRNVFSIAPFIVNSAFSIELYLKTLGQMHNTALKGHKLTKLFDSLPQEAKQKIAAIGPACAMKHGLPGHVDFRVYLMELNNSFLEWRYCYEKDRTDEVRIQPTIFVMEVLHEACRENAKL